MLVGKRKWSFGDIEKGESMVNRSRILVGTLVAVSALSLSADHHKIEKANIVGTWLGVGIGPNGEESESTLVFSLKEGKLKATSESENGEVRNLDRVKFDGESLKGEIDIDYNGQSGVLGVKAKLGAKGEFKGNWFANDGDGNELYSGDWTAVRSLKKAVAGSWDVVASTSNGDNEHQLVVTKGNSGLEASVHSNDGSVDISKIRVKRNELSFQFEFGDGTIKVAAVQSGPKELKGKWTYFDSSDVEVGSGDWNATK